MITAKRRLYVSLAIARFGFGLAAAAAIFGFALGTGEARADSYGNKTVRINLACAKSLADRPSLSLSCARKAITKTAPEILAAANDDGNGGFTLRRITQCKRRSRPPGVKCEVEVEDRYIGDDGKPYCALEHPEPDVTLKSARRGRVRVYWFYGGESFPIYDCSGNVVATGPQW